MFRECLLLARCFVKYLLVIPKLNGCQFAGEEIWLRKIKSHSHSHTNNIRGRRPKSETLYRA